MFNIEDKGHQSCAGYLLRNSLANGLPLKTQFHKQGDRLRATEHKVIDRYSGLAFNSNEMHRIVKRELGDAVTERARKDLLDAVRPFGIDTLFSDKFLFNEEFRYCPECIKKAYHSIYTGLNFVSECEIHKGTALVSECPVCGSKMPDFIDINAGKGYVCSSCGHELSGFQYPEDLLKIMLGDKTVYPKLESNAPEDDLRGMIRTTGKEDYFVKDPEIADFLLNYFRKGERPEPDIKFCKGTRFENDFEAIDIQDDFGFITGVREFRMIPDYTTERTAKTKFKNIFKEVSGAGIALAMNIFNYYSFEYYMLTSFYVKLTEMSEDEILNYIYELRWPQLEYCLIQIETADSYDFYIFRYAALPAGKNKTMHKVEKDDYFHI